MICKNSAVSKVGKPRDAFRPAVQLAKNKGRRENRKFVAQICPSGDGSFRSVSCDTGGGTGKKKSEVIERGSESERRVLGIFQIDSPLSEEQA
jgi:hypothetical protein